VDKTSIPKKVTKVTVHKTVAYSSSTSQGSVAHVTPKTAVPNRVAHLAKATQQFENSCATQKTLIVATGVSASMYRLQGFAFGVGSIILFLLCAGLLLFFGGGCRKYKREEAKKEASEAASI
jgi:hypothetical protein